MEAADKAAGAGVDACAEGYRSVMLMSADEGIDG